MKIVPDGNIFKIAIIDPKKDFGAEGQYIPVEGTLKEVEAVAKRARLAGMEIRWYYRNLQTFEGEEIASQTIITEIPPGHIQPFHTHHTIHEVTLVLEGSVVAVDHDDFDEKIDVGILWANGALVEKHFMVIEGPGTRHTIMNVGHTYAKLVTVQTARMGIKAFPADWHRDKPSD